jgi:S1-C subfamily serine protease
MRRVATIFVIALAAAWSGAGHAAAATTTPTKGVVLITTNLALENGNAAGTGMVITSNGEVLTNNHVIRGATTINVTIPSTHKTYTAKALGYDISDDVALIKLNGASNLTTIAKGNSDKLRVGQASTAVGNANGGGKLVITKGAVTALNRTISIQDDTGEVSQLANLIQTSARLVPGDSGGPLLDSAGRVIGINAQIRSQVGGGFEGVAFAVPIDTAIRSLAQLLARGHVTYAYAGLTTEDLTPAIARRFGYAATAGALIDRVDTRGPAARAGLRAGSRDVVVAGQEVTVGGDAIVAIDDIPVASSDDVARFISERLLPGQVADFTIVRGRHHLRVPVTLGSRRP